MSALRARVIVEIRNGDGNFLKILRGEFVEVEGGHMLRACAASFDTALQNQKAEAEHHPGHD